MSEITLACRGLELVVAPERGGSIIAFRHDGFDLMRAWTEGGDPQARPGFPLVPFSGRIDRGRFTFAGRDYALPLSPGHPHAIHGDGRGLPWRVEAAAATTLHLVLDHDAPDAVFRYRAEQSFTLHPDRLEVELAVTHRGDAPMPYGLGLHPYFDRRPDTLLSAEVAGVWMPDAANIPRRLEPVPIGWGFRLRRNVNELELDHNFQGWTGTARLDWPESGRSLLIEADPIFRHLVVYVPPGRSFFCVEPVSHVADGINLMARGVEETGVRVLEPGGRLAGAIRFSSRQG